jgi:hypothetical protein
MESSDLRIANLKVQLTLLKREEANLRYIRSLPQTGPEDRQDANAQLASTVKKLMVIVRELRELEQ